MFAGLIPGLNSVNAVAEDEVVPGIPAILTSLINLSNQKFMSTVEADSATLFTQSLDYFRREWSEECRCFVTFVPLIYFCIFIAIVLIALSSGEGEEEKDGGGDTEVEVAGESPETDASLQGSMGLCRNELFNANGGFILPESHDPSHSFCRICFEEKRNWQMFTNESCSHAFCYDCTAKHIEAKVQENITVICCPEIDCIAELGFEACRNIVSEDVIVQWDECLCISLIPESQKVYCPFKDCSAMLLNDTGEMIGETECPVCRRLFCAKCRAPWHTEFTCKEFERFGVEIEGREDMVAEELANGGFILPESHNPSQSFCGICFEEKQNWQMFVNENCSHAFCYDCTGKHIEAKVQDNITAIRCPEIDCKAELGFEACRNMLPEDVIARWAECLCMSQIPESHKVYCPFKDCSAMLLNDTGETIRETECVVCRRLICAKCRVPWHTEFTCDEFGRLGAEEGEGREDALVKELAKKKSWRKCLNCNIYVEKTQGCLHITCRCGYEFCYMCGSKWDISHKDCSHVRV
ncbi:hypothetical protein Vadar_001365 [Vaccinium darrowii]|uniref:Uncharacterized protein n=1 Tax=Vaccinium darrowii TaxID=229202 RepID=A0ACB7Y492_9ERIC|nr:hypothetical protein Vadar_001365 [Vaccinium darrowii]